MTVTRLLIGWLLLSLAGLPLVSLYAQPATPCKVETRGGMWSPERCHEIALQSTEQHDCCRQDKQINGHHEHGCKHCLSAVVTSYHYPALSNMVDLMAALTHASYRAINPPVLTSISLDTADRPPNA